TQLLRHGHEFAGAWNFAPQEAAGVTARTVVERAITLWGSGEWRHEPAVRPHRETGVLRLNWDKAANRLGWRPVYTWEEALAATVDWFKTYREQPNSSMYAKCASQIAAYTERARELALPWVGRGD
ncbi:MAG TPA: CDP-glucose 4,6-dehydratase, partial [Candidatus Binatia bacterium]|nr:CDP-glucose 4,6-dehydratase [Candidatus Binatia bacterium]